MVSGAGGPTGSYGAYSPPMSSSERTVLEANQMFKKAMVTTDPRYKAAMAQRASAPTAQPAAPPPQEKGIFGKMWDSVTSIF